MIERSVAYYKARTILSDATGDVREGNRLIQLLTDAEIVFSFGDPEIVTTREEITTDVEIPLISKDEMLRLEALTIANDGAIHHGVSAEHVLGRAEIFVDYIKNGVQTDG